MKNGKFQEGFTLIEILISIALIGIIIVPILGIFLQSTRNNVDSKIKTQTVAVAQSVMEYYKGSGIEKLNDVIANICHSGESYTNDGDTATLYYFTKKDDNLSTVLSNAEYDHFKNAEGTEQFDAMLASAGSQSFDYAIKVVLKVKDQDNDPDSIDLVQIFVNVWYKPLGENSKVNLISLRGK